MRNNENEIVETLERQIRMIEARNDKLRAIISDNINEQEKLQVAIDHFIPQKALDLGDTNL